MGKLLALRAEYLEPEYGDGDGDGEEDLHCPSCDGQDWRLVEDEDEGEIIVRCSNCGQEVDISSVED